MPAMKNIIIFIVIAGLGLGGFMMWKKHHDAAKVAVPTDARAVITVTTAHPVQKEWPLSISAAGNIEAWQLATIGAEISGIRITEIDADVGDTVKKGQVLAKLSQDTIKALLDQQTANVEKAQAALDQAAGDAKRAKTLKGTGALSDQQVTEYMTAEQSAKADLNVAKAALATQQLNFGYATIVAPDDGVIATRSAAVGEMVQAGTELFSIINQGRLEWRAQVAEKDIGLIAPESKATVMTLQGKPVEGKIRLISPVIDPATRDGLVYVDVPADGGLKQGMFVKGTIDLGTHDTLVVPEAAVVVQNGYSYLFTLQHGGKVKKTRVETGRRREDGVEIREGASAADVVAVKGAGFLNDGDKVTAAESPDAVPHDAEKPAETKDDSAPDADVAPAAGGDK